MPSFERLRSAVQWLGGLALAATLASIFQGLYRGLRRPAGRASGSTAAWLRRPAFYAAASLGYFGLCALLWRPLPRPPARARAGLELLVGALCYFPGLALVIAGRLALGRDYFVSTTRGAQLFAGHRLVTHGPYARVRHPMYLGLILASLGGLLIYRTWTWVLAALNTPALMLRARREEQVLSAEFGADWQNYAGRVRFRLLPGIW
jgi:protein-S-isoprenylcysteine O-methyltransferase Ste14